MSSTMIALIAAEQQKLIEQEEESMTKYSKNDLDQWEFKIVRANLNFKNFKNSYELNNLLKEESLAGWELVEKFDNQRIRLKRKISARKNDQNLTIDPYRTNIGSSEQQIVAIFLIMMFLFIVLTMIIAS